MRVKSISFAEIEPIWRERLWPGRTSAIEPTSAIVFNAFPYLYDMDYTKEEPFFFGAFIYDQMVGVNSGHATGGMFRSRGLYVHPAYRGKGIGSLLLKSTIDQAKALNKIACWSMPRETSLKAYQSAGFKKCSDWFGTETSDKNCFAIVRL